MMEVTVKVSDEASPALQRLIKALDTEERAELNQVGARAANTAAIEYHQEFNQAGGWRGSNYMTGPGSTPGEFGQNVALGWNFDSADRDGASIRNNADYYAFKVTGGTIKPKRVANLTIPMIPEAAGRRVRDYEAATGNVLFRVLGKKALFEKTENGGIRAVYALVKEVTQKPWIRALPDEETLSSNFIKGWTGALADILEDS